MKEIILTILYSLFSACTLIFIWHRLLNKKINFKNKRLYITLFFLTVIPILNFFMVNKFIKIILITVFFMISFRFLFKEDLKKCIITPLYYQIIVMISETIFVLIILTILKLDIRELEKQYIGTFIVNIATPLNTLIISNIPIVRKVYNLILSGIERINKKFLIILSLSIISIANILITTTYNSVDIRVLFILNVIYTLFCFFVVIYSFRMQSNYNKVSDKYNVAINSLTDYENMMSKYRIANHENKNLLLTVRAMILNKEKDIPKYIDSMVEEKYEDNEKLLLKTSVIPSGGLRATIYSEILKIKDNNINYSLIIDKKIKTIDLIELDTNTIIDICKIIGVFIDNAIDEVKKLKIKNIAISLYLEDNFLSIKVSNNYKDKIDINKIFDEGYTTKGKGHGYGLSLVKRIVENNKNFENKTEISKNMFCQILFIKYKKTH